MVSIQRALQPLFKAVALNAKGITAVIPDLHASNLSVAWFFAMKNMFGGLGGALVDVQVSSESIKVDPFLLRLSGVIAQAKVDTMQAKVDTMQARVSLQNSKIGWYTKEQEADDVATQLMTSVGIPVETLESMFFKILKQREAGRGSNNLGLDVLNYETCMTAYKSGFSSPDFQQKYVKIGKYDEDNHHSECYRIFNAFRIRRTEHFVLGQQPLPFLPESQFKQLAENIHAAAFQAPKVSGPAAESALQKFEMLLHR